jgi:glycosyltransferase involved in cell wall biosynthesis
MHFRVVIPTYNRAEELDQLITDLRWEGMNHRLDIAVYDDGSDEYVIDEPGAAYRPPRQDHVIPPPKRSPVEGVEFHRLQHHGKRRYWQLVDYIFRTTRGKPFDYLVYLADDLRLKPGFFDRALAIWGMIPNRDKVCLNLMQDQRRGKRSWTDFRPVHHGAYWQSQWVDMCFMATRGMLEFLKYEMWSIPESHWDGWKSRSSGVGRQISLRLHEEGKGIYQVDESLVIHDGTKPSKMNPARAGQPTRRPHAA